MLQFSHKSFTFYLWSGFSSLGSCAKLSSHYYPYSHWPFFQRTYSPPWGAYSRAAARDQRYRLSQHRCHFCQLFTPLAPERVANLFVPNLYTIASCVFFPNQYRNPGPNRNLTLGPNPNPNPDPDPNYRPSPNPNPTINPRFTSFYFLRNGYTG
jgi:hypothetical protein